MLFKYVTGTNLLKHVSNMFQNWCKLIKEILLLLKY